MPVAYATGVFNKLMDWQAFLEIDRAVLEFFNGSNSLFLDLLMSLLTSGFTWIPLYLALFYLIVKNNETMAQIGLAVGCTLLCLALTDGMADGLIKPLVARLRPVDDPSVAGSVDTVYGVFATGYSFFSAHAANTMGIAVFFAPLVRNRVFTWFMVLWALLNGYTRLYLGVHYPSDVLAGFLWGMVAATLSYFIYQKVYKRITPALNYISSQYTSTGYSLKDVDVVLSVLVYTIAIVILGSPFIFH